MRSLHRASYGLVALLAACGTAASVPVADPEPTASGTPPSATATSERPQPSSTVRPLDGFPLARGYPASNGNDGSPVVVTAGWPADTLVFCGLSALTTDAPGSPVDAIGATYEGEAEDSRGITLGRYENAELAAKVMAGVQIALKRCPEESGDDGLGTVQSGARRAVGDAGYTITKRFRGPSGFDTGLVVYDLVRVGDLLLLNWQYGEGGGSEETIDRSRRRVTDQSDDLLPEMCEYAEPACAVREPVPVVQVGPDGVDGIVLGMSEEAAAEAGLLGEPRHDGSGCTVVFRDDESGTYAVTGDTRPGVGVVSVSATTDTVTPEGVGTGATVDQVRGAYPDATDHKTGWMASVPGHPGRSYWFLLAPDGLVTRVLLVLTEERCDS